MSRKTALILTAALTVFVLVVSTALAIRLGTFSADPAPSAEVNSTTSTVPATVEAVVPQEQILQREQSYQQRLEEANAQLQQAYQQLQQLQAQLQQLQAQNAILLEREQIYQQRLEEANRLLQQSAAASSPPSGPGSQLQEGTLLTTGNMISAEQAAQIAVQYVGGGGVRKVELEDERGALTYEVKVGGSEVYVDAYTGQVVYAEYEERERGGYEREGEWDDD